MTERASAHDATAPRPRREKPRPWRIGDIVDGRALRVRLSTAALNNIGDENATRASALDILHQALFRGRMIAQERLQEGADGLDTARLLAAVQDEVLSALFDFTTVHVFRARNPTEGERMAVMATGGYGRGALGPGSDIDLLFVRSYKATAWAESVIEYMLYMLWDMGLKVGHAFRTIEECIRLSEEDVTIKTSILDARYLFGDADLAAEMKATFRQRAVEGTDVEFIAAKLAERDARHDARGETRYVVEPNVKDGKGGLRDLQTMFWILKHLYGGEALEEVMETGFLDPRERRTFLRAARFLWSVRCHLHFMTGREEDRLSFDLQPEMARRFGYVDRGERLGVERFMKRYFIVAKEVGVLTRILSARLEAARKKADTGRLRRMLAGDGARAIDEPGFIIETGRLSVGNEDIFRDDPVQMLRLFAVADRYALDLHPFALTEVMRSLSHLTPAYRENEEARQLFLEVATSYRDPAGTLRLMNEAGVLGRFLPEFGRIVAQTQFNMYHHYTVDEHTLRAVATVSDIEHNRLDAHPLPHKVFQKLRQRQNVYLAMLLHDTGKGRGDQQEVGALTARAASLRLGLSDSDATEVAWLVGHHLEMSETAQKRDISDPRTIAQFAQLCETEERLRGLYVLTVADICAVGPGVWNAWKGQLLAELYKNTAAALADGRPDEEGVTADLQERAEDRRWAVSQALGGLTETQGALDDAYWAGFEVEELVWHGRVLKTSEASEVIVKARAREDGSGVALLVSCPDRVGLFADLAGAMAGQSANIVSAQVFTSETGRVMDVFLLQNERGELFAAGDPHRLEALERAVFQAASDGGIEAVNLPTRRVGRREAAFLVEPKVSFDDTESADHTVIDLSGRDRAGLLYEITREISEMGLSIGSAHVGSYGERVFDAFYVRKGIGGKSLDAATKSALKERLLAVLSRDEPEAPATPVRQLKRARSADSF